MKMRISSIPVDGTDYDFSVEARDITADLPKKDPLRDCIRTPLTAHIHAEKFNRNVTLSGDYSIRMQPVCDRCLETFERPIDARFQLTCVPQGGDLEEDNGLSLYHGDELDLGKLVCTQMLETLPMKFLCKDECLGLCPKCGANLNLAPCTCDAPKAKH